MSFQENLLSIAENIQGEEALRSVKAKQIKKWAEIIGKEMADGKVTRGYFLNIVSQITSVFNTCQATLAQKGTINYDSLVFIEPHIGYQAKRKKSEKEALQGLQKLFNSCLEKLSQTENDKDAVEDLKRLNQFFQSIAAYYVVYKTKI